MVSEKLYRNTLKHHLLRAIDHNYMEKARYKFLIVIIISPNKPTTK